MISMVVPSLSILDAQIEQVDKAVADCEKLIKQKEQAAAEVKADPEFAKYLILATNIKQGAVKLTLAHQENWQKMVSRFARPSGVLEKLNAEIQELLKRIQTLRLGQENMLKAREKSGSGVRCEIGQIEGDTRVRTLVANEGIPEFRRLKAVERKTKLREPGTAMDRVFSGDKGDLDWTYIVPRIAGHG
jgi:hypothetical protein